jgi:ribonuclease HI
MKLDPNKTNGTSPPTDSLTRPHLAIAMRQDHEIWAVAQSHALSEDDSQTGLQADASHARRATAACVVGSQSEGSMNRPEVTRIRAWFDGACEPQNPGGHASWGAVVEIDGQVIFSKHGYVGMGPAMSSNVAEYCGCIAVLEEIRKHDGDAIIFGDSKLVINQMSGRWGVRNGGLYLPYFRQASAILDLIGRNRAKFRWIPREQNGRADDLSKQALLERDIVPAQRKKWSTRKRRAVAAWKKRQSRRKKNLSSHNVAQEEPRDEI